MFAIAAVFATCAYICYMRLYSIHVAIFAICGYIRIDAAIFAICGYIHNILLYSPYATVYSLYVATFTVYMWLYSLYAAIFDVNTCLYPLCVTIFTICGYVRHMRQCSLFAAIFDICGHIRYMRPCSIYAAVFAQPYWLSIYGHVRSTRGYLEFWLKNRQFCYADVMRILCGMPSCALW